MLQSNIIMINRSEYTLYDLLCSIWCTYFLHTLYTLLTVVFYVFCVYNTTVKWQQKYWDIWINLISFILKMCSVGDVVCSVIWYSNYTQPAM